MVDAYTSKDVIIAEDYQGEFVLSDFAAGAVAELRSAGLFRRTADPPDASRVQSPRPKRPGLRGLLAGRRLHRRAADQ